MSGSIVREDVDGLARITINRPEKSNALTAADKIALARAVEEAASAEDVLCLLLTGSGNRAFCAGSDIQEMQDFSTAEMYRMLGAERRMYRAIIESPKPVVAAVNGHALGAGAILVMCCDYAVAAEHAQFGTPELTIGVAAPLEGLLLPWLVGLGKARAMYFRAERLTADDAVEFGLIHEAVPSEECGTRAAAVAKEIGALPGRGFSVQKRTLNLLLHSGNLEAAIQASHEATAAQFAELETGSAMRHFLESRRSERKGRSNG